MGPCREFRQWWLHLYYSNNKGMTTQIEFVWNLKPLVISGNATKGQEEKEDVDTELRINSGH